MLDSLKQKKNFQRIKMRIKTGDLVKVINGKDKGKTGEVLKTIQRLFLLLRRWFKCWIH